MADEIFSHGVLLPDRVREIWIFVYDIQVKIYVSFATIIEGGLSHKEVIHNDAEGPNVYLGVIASTLDDLVRMLRRVLPLGVGA
jgi:hypothetical protein